MGILKRILKRTERPKMAVPISKAARKALLKKAKKQKRKDLFTRAEQGLKEVDSASDSIGFIVGDLPEMKRKKPTFQKPSALQDPLGGDFDF